MGYGSAVGDGCVCVGGGGGGGEGAGRGGGLEGAGRGDPDYRSDVGGHDESKCPPSLSFPPFQVAQ